MLCYSILIVISHNSEYFLFCYECYDGLGQPGLVSSFCGSLGVVYPLQRLLQASNADSSYRTYLSDK